MQKCERRIADYLKQNGYSNIGDRFVHFDNRLRPMGNVLALFEKIGSNLMIRKGLPYTNISFQKAQAILEEEKQKLRSELETNLRRFKKIALDKMTREIEEEMKIFEYQLDEYAISAYSAQAADIAMRDFFSNQINSLKKGMADFQVRKKTEMENSVQTVMAKCEEEFNSKIYYLKTKVQNQALLLNDANAKIENLQHQVNRLANR